MLFVSLVVNQAGATEVDRLLASENKAHGIELDAVPVVDDLAFLRRVYVDLIGRIPSQSDIREYATWPAAERRARVIDKLLAHERFSDRWTVFFADMLRLRYNAEGGSAALAYVHQGLETGMPYDEMARRFLSFNGKANRDPEVGFVLGDNADPLALASATSQVFMGVRIGCAQCHDHPFDVWTRKDFYGLAAYFGRTQRVESQLTKLVYTTEGSSTRILWPPEDEAEMADRKPMVPTFPFQLASAESASDYIARLTTLRAPKPEEVDPEATVDDLLTQTAAKANAQTKASPADLLGIAGEAKDAIRQIDIKASLYRESEWRAELASMVTNPRNRYFSQSLVNRLWHELVGRGFVEPVDDFREDNPPSHPETLSYLADEFVAGGYDLRNIVRLIVTSDVYQRGHATGLDEKTQGEMEAAFVATPMRRMLSEAMYDSVVTAGHLFEVKHPKGENNRVEMVEVRVPKEPADGSIAKVQPLLGGKPIDPQEMASMMEAGEMTAMPATGYALEQAIELDFGALLKKEEVSIDKMKIVSAEEIESQRMAMEAAMKRPGGGYVTKVVKRVVDDNPQFNSSLRMASPAPAGHFLRVFGQPARNDLGDLRDDSPTMRQALMMLNGKMTHEASRVGKLEQIYPLLDSDKPDLEGAVRLVYLDIFTRRPTAEEIEDAKIIITAAENPLEGMADLRWVMLNSNEFRFLP